MNKTRLIKKQQLKNKAIEKKLAKAKEQAQIQDEILKVEIKLSDKDRELLAKHEEEEKERRKKQVNLIKKFFKSLFQIIWSIFEGLVTILDSLTKDKKKKGKKK